MEGTQRAKVDTASDRDLGLVLKAGAHAVEFDMVRFGHPAQQHTECSLMRAESPLNFLECHLKRESWKGEMELICRWPPQGLSERRWTTERAFFYVLTSLDVILIIGHVRF